MLGFAPYCDLTDMAACQGLSLDEAACIPFFRPGEAPKGLEHVGVCGVAP